jgi:guanylate kinase
MGRLIILAGPSCVGKSPLFRALRRLYPQQSAGLSPLVLYNSRSPRPGEVDGEDYHFRARAEIEQGGKQGRLRTLEVRGDLQGLDEAELTDQLASGDVLFEGNPFVGRLLLEVDLPAGCQRLSVFMSPLSADELRELADPQRHVDVAELVADVMRRKLLRRTARQKGLLSEKDLANIERRCTSAYGELKLAGGFDGVLPCHDGEDSENWDAFYYPLGDARTALRAMVDVLAGRRPDELEDWDDDLLR